VRSLALLLLAGCAGTSRGPDALRPLHAAADLSIGESATLELSDGTKATVKLVGLKETVDDVNGAVRRAEVKVEVDGRPVDLVCGTYHLPVKTGRVQIDCPITKGYTAKARQGMPGQASKLNVWGFEKDARVRLWPEGSPWIEPGTFGYPARQRWFASFTQMGNEPVYVDGGDMPGKKDIYYHYGNDIGGPEGLVDVVAATDGLVVVSGNEKLDGHEGTPAATRYDVIYLLDARGWYYRYSHLKWIEARVRIGARVKKGEKLGVLGKEGGSGGWSHLHFDISRRQPSGQWGIEDGYAFLWEAYQREHPAELVAVARPHSLIWAGQTATLDASSSMGEGLRFDWGFSKEARVERRYDVPGSYCETVKVTDASGREDVDFAVVHVLDRAAPDKLPPAIHAAYAPSFGIRPGSPVTFFVRSFRAGKAEETWDFGDGTPPVKVSSDGNAEVHAAMGYAQTIHRFAKAGRYIVSVERPGAVARLYVRVEK
jgi:murein DD-endopeptidase MepM/ murein hydrolase activator NlpD